MVKNQTMKNLPSNISQFTILGSRMCLLYKNIKYRSWAGNMAPTENPCIESYILLKFVVRDELQV